MRRTSQAAVAQGERLPCKIRFAKQSVWTVFPFSSTEVFSCNVTRLPQSEQRISNCEFSMRHSRTLHLILRSPEGPP